MKLMVKLIFTIILKFWLILCSILFNLYFEEFQFIDDAIKREKQLKNWHRQWKINLIEEKNPNWDDLWIVREKSRI